MDDVSEELERRLRLVIVPDQYGACPRCGAYWGNPDPDLNFPNRAKVDNDWRCYNPSCTAGYYNPETRLVVEEQATPQEEAASRARAAAWVEKITFGKHWETTDHGNGMSTAVLVDD
jgi:hypothetical protein